MPEADYSFNLFDDNFESRTGKPAIEVHESNDTDLDRSRKR